MVVVNRVPRPSAWAIESGTFGAKRRAAKGIHQGFFSSTRQRICT
jgi:hypothetical protein